MEKQEDSGGVGVGVGASEVSPYQGWGLQSLMSETETGQSQCGGSKESHKGLQELQELHLLCPQVGPSQPSLQMQVKASPPPTQVPPLEQGLEAQVLFVAGGTRESGTAISALVLLILASPGRSRHF